MNSLILIRFSFIVLIFVGTRSFASETRITQDSLINLKLDTSWLCNKDKSGNMCEQLNGKIKVPKIIIWTAKEKGPADTFEQYRSHLEHPIELSFKDKKVQSKVKYLRVGKINGQEWIDAVHWQSEVPGYYTRYLATVNSRYAVLITFSGKKDIFVQFNKEMASTILGLKLAQ